MAIELQWVRLGLTHCPNMVQAARPAVVLRGGAKLRSALGGVQLLLHAHVVVAGLFAA